jgi:hypothetical protein
MSHADRPYLTRPLAGVDQALGEGRARPPVELLDVLRERLDRLDPNHPSASQASADTDEAPGRDATDDRDVTADQVVSHAAARGENGRVSRGDQRGDRPGDRGVGEPPVVRQAGLPAAADSAVDGQAAEPQVRAVDARRADKGERYRPWFAHEPGTPWFVEQEFIE